MRVMCVFWAAMPHQLSEGEAVMYWVTLPLPLFLRWQLPEALATAVLQGKPVVRRGEANGGDAPLRQWLVDLTRGGGHGTIVQLELEAYLRRMALDGDANVPAPGVQTGGHGGQMAQYIADNFVQPLHVAQIAAHAGLHPHYAMQLFRETYGLSLIDYLTRCRIAHAQQLLVVSDMSVPEVALESGFNSASRFYSAFKAECGTTPRAYRAAARGELGTMKDER